MIKRILTIITVALLIGLLVVPSGCVKEDFDKVPLLVDSSSWSRTIAIAEVKALLTVDSETEEKSDLIRNLATQDFWNIINNNGGTDIIIEGYVISSDSASNFYETVTIFDETGGIDLKINADELYLTYGLKPGKKVLVKLNDMALGYYHGAYQVGYPITDAGVLNVTGVELGKLPEFVQRSGKKITIEPLNLKISEINNSHVQKLIKIDSVQFWNPAATYSVPGINTNRVLVDKNGNQIILRNSGFAKFTNDFVPSGSGSVTGVLSIYDDTYQLYIRDLNDVQFNDPRFGADVPTPNNTIAELKALCTSNLVQINQDVVIEAVVNANDKSGNLYKQLFIEDASGAIEFKIDMSGLYTDFPVGTKIVVNCNGLYVGKYGGVVQLGGLYNGSIGRLSPSIFYNKVYITEAGIEINPIETTITGLTDDLIGKIITLNDVQFVDLDLGKTYAEGTTTTNRNIEDNNSNTVIVRTSGYADFAGITVPSNKGKITAVLSKFNSDFQLYIRSMVDVRMLEPRRVKNYLISQTFSGVTINQPITVDGWKSIAIAGSKQWIGKDYSGNKYAEMNPYNSGEASNIGWLISPKVTIPSGSNAFLSFATQFSYWANSQLEVFVSNDYNGTDPNSATWTEITDAYIIQESDGYNKWVKSGNVNISNYSGDIYIGFKYTGGGTIGQTTAFRVDDVAVFTQE